MTPDGYTVGDVHGTKFNGKLLAILLHDVDAWREALDAYDKLCSLIYHKHGIEVLQAQTPVDISDNLVMLFHQGSFTKVCEMYSDAHEVNTIIWRKGIYGT